jgi:RimJ/RimL family protein N-acetyltransferase
MNIIECPDVDLIEPFPPQEIPRVWKWMHCKKTLVETDGFPKTQEAFVEIVSQLLPMTRSWGVIDKNNLLKIRHEAPLIGLISFEPVGPWSGRLHAIGPRRAWGYEDPENDRGFVRLIDQAAMHAMADTFASYPSLLRVGLEILDTNFAARRWAKRIGMEFEGATADMVLVDGTPATVAQYGITRRKLEALNGDRVSSDPS